MYSSTTGRKQKLETDRLRIEFFEAKYSMNEMELLSVVWSI